MNEVQENLLKMMVDLDRILRAHGIYYALEYGTALGAVRHKGFIPWDDDLDVTIRREDVDRFREAVKDLPEGEYYLQEPLSTDWMNLFFKLRKNNTTAIEPDHLSTRMHQGLFIDVFILEKYPDSRFRRLLYDTVMTAEHVLQTISFKTYGKPKLDWLQRLFVWTVRKTDALLDMLPEEHTEYCTYRLGEFKRLIRSRYAEGITEVDFEGHRFTTFKDIHERLTDYYGDYMTLPPEDQRVGDHLSVFRADMDYKDWLRENGKEGE